MVTSISNKTLKEIIKDEYLRCAKDSTYFIKKYCIIQHPVKGKIPFQLWQFQEEVVNLFRKNRFSIILKARQLGISSLVAGYALWLMLFHGDKKILVIATKQGVAKNLVTKVRVMHSNLPTWLKGKCIADNKLSLEFANGSSILAEAASPEAGRSEALSLLILDEAAFIDYIDTIWAAAAMTLATGGDAIVLSTPNGVGNLLHKRHQPMHHRSYSTPLNCIGRFIQNAIKHGEMNKISYLGRGRPHKSVTATLSVQVKRWLRVPSSSGMKTPV